MFRFQEFGVLGENSHHFKTLLVYVSPILPSNKTKSTFAAFPEVETFMNPDPPTPFPDVYPY